MSITDATYSVINTFKKSLLHNYWHDTSISISGGISLMIDIILLTGTLLAVNLSLFMVFVILFSCKLYNSFKPQGTATNPVAKTKNILSNSSAYLHKISKDKLPTFRWPSILRAHPNARDKGKSKYSTSKQQSPKAQSLQSVVADKKQVKLKPVAEPIKHIPNAMLFEYIKNLHQGKAWSNETTSEAHDRQKADFLSDNAEEIFKSAQESFSDPQKIPFEDPYGTIVAVFPELETLTDTKIIAQVGKHHKPENVDQTRNYNQLKKQHRIRLLAFLLQNSTHADVVINDLCHVATRVWKISYPYYTTFKQNFYNQFKDETHPYLPDDIITIKNKLSWSDKINQASTERLLEKINNNTQMAIIYRIVHLIIQTSYNPQFDAPKAYDELILINRFQPEIFNKIIKSNNTTELQSLIECHPEIIDQSLLSINP